MSHSRSVRAVLSGSLVVLVMSSSALIGTAGAALAAPISEVNADSSGTTVSSGPTIAGISLGTFSWALVGLTVLVLGFIAASRAGRRAPVVVTRPGFNPAVALRPFHPSIHESQDEPTSAVTV